VLHLDPVFLDGENGHTDPPSPGGKTRSFSGASAEA
jgi:hypothetical protein